MNIKSTVFTIVFGALAATSAAHGSDLSAWRASGLEQAHAGEQTPDTFSKTYRDKRTAYQQLIAPTGSQARIAHAPEHTLTRAEVIADLAAWRAAGLEQEHAGEQTPDTFSATYRAKRALYRQLRAQSGSQAGIEQTPERTLTRAEVRTDAAAWRAAGLEQAHAGEQTPNTHSVAYQQKLAAYHQLLAQG